MQEDSRRGIRFSNGAFEARHQVPVRSKIEQSLIAVPFFFHRLMSRGQLLILTAKLFLDALNVGQALPQPRVGFLHAAKNHLEGGETLGKTVDGQGQRLFFGLLADLRPQRLNDGLLVRGQHLEQTRALGQSATAGLVGEAQRRFATSRQTLLHGVRVLFDQRFRGCAHAVHPR